LHLTLSRQLSRVTLDGLPTATRFVARASGFRQSAPSGAGYSSFSEAGALSQTHLAAGKAFAGLAHDVAAESWLIDRAGQRELLAIARPDELPSDAIATREQPPRPAAAPCSSCPHPRATA
jgi:hypothetical protein